MLAFVVRGTITRISDVRYTTMMLQLNIRGLLEALEYSWLNNLCLRYDSQSMSSNSKNRKSRSSKQILCYHHGLIRHMRIKPTIPSQQAGPACPNISSMLGFFDFASAIVFLFVDMFK